MMRRFAFRLAALLALLVGTMAYGAYVYEDDIYIGFCTDKALAAYVDGLISIGMLGQEMFKLQEGVHDTFTDTTDEEIDHYYIWIGHCGRYIPLDPFHVNK